MQMRGKIFNLSPTVWLTNALARAMSRDEARFPNAEDFVPERFLNDEGKLNENDPMDFAFGFGRRICPGTCTCGHVR